MRGERAGMRRTETQIFVTHLPYQSKVLIRLLSLPRAKRIILRASAFRPITPASIIYSSVDNLYTLVPSRFSIPPHSRFSEVYKFCASHQLSIYILRPLNLLLHPFLLALSIKFQNFRLQARARMFSAPSLARFLSSRQLFR